MEYSSGQKYVIHTFMQGIIRDVNPDIPPNNRTYYKSSNFFEVFHESINGLSAGQGISDLSGGPVSNADLTFIGSVYYDSHIYHFWSKVSGLTGTTYIYKDYTLIGQHEDYPGSPVTIPIGQDAVYLYMDVDHETGDVAITDGISTPIVLNLDDMVSHSGDTTYKADYDKTLYTVNANIELSAPKFVDLADMSIGGGQRPGSYAYSYRLVSNTGDKSPWSPPTPFIPVPANYGVVSPTNANKVNPGGKWYGEAPSLSPTRYGIRLRFRVNNVVGFDFMELKRWANHDGSPVDYTALAERVQLPNDIRSSKYNVIDFTDTNNIMWGPHDENDDITLSSVDTCRTVRFYKGRLILGDVTYTSKIIDDPSIFLDIVTGKQGVPIKENLGVNGYNDIQAQVYKKSQRLGERHSWGVRCGDGTGNRAFVIPAEDLSNYKMPERREEIPAAEEAFSPDAPSIPPIDSNNSSYTLEKTYEVFIQGETAKGYTTGIRNIVSDIGTSDPAPYHPFVPTRRTGGFIGDNPLTIDRSPVNLTRYSRLGNRLTAQLMAQTEKVIGNILAPRQAYTNQAGYAGNSGNFADYQFLPSDDVESQGGFSPEIFGPEILATGMRMGGIDRSALPEWVKSFSFVRTEAAGRVVAQGLAMYALQDNGITSLATKALNKFWFYSPELDAVIGNKNNIYQDMIEHPEDYEIQLVSPVGFVPEYWSGLVESGQYGHIDMAAYANMYFGGSSSINPFDTASNVGDSTKANGYITFGTWRNQGAVGTGVSGESSPYEYIFGMTNIQEADMDGKNGRANYLELTLDANVYAETDFYNGSADHSDSRAAHEPWYIVNIIKSGAVAPSGSGAVYKEIGHNIVLDSTIGIGDGSQDISLPLVSERRGDVEATGHTSGTASTYRYVYVNGRPWIDTTNMDSGEETTLRGNTPTQFAAGSVTYDGITVYGLYKVLQDIDGTYKVTFGYSVSGGYSYPAEGEKIVVKYDENEPIDIFLGDTIIAETGFTPIDCESQEWDGSTDVRGNEFHMGGAFIYKDFSLNPQHIVPDDVAAVTQADRYQTDEVVEVDFIRQLFVSFIVETPINIPLLYGEFFPHTNYIMRPNVYDARESGESIEEYLNSLNIYSGYDQDYPDEYLNWGYGGFRTPRGLNLDYSKQHGGKSIALPESGIDEILHYPKRLHWSVERPAAFSDLDGIRSFLPANIYDLKDNKSTGISILYDAFTSQGNNLYAITDQGVAILLVNKNILSSAIGDLNVLTASPSMFIADDLWINRKAKSKGQLFRGRAEGTITTTRNTEVSVLVFVDDSKVYALMENQVIDLSRGMRSTLKYALRNVGDLTELSAAINNHTNSLWLLINDTIYTYSFDIDNWVRDRRLSESVLEAIHSAEDFNSRSDRLAFVHYADPTIDIKYTDETRITDTMETISPEISLDITPGVGEFEFVDVIVKATDKPYSIKLETDDESVTIAAADIKTLRGGKYYCIVPRGATASGKLISDTVTITITYGIGDVDKDSEVSMIKIGYREINQ